MAVVVDFNWKSTPKNLCVQSKAYVVIFLNDVTGLVDGCRSQ